MSGRAGIVAAIIAKDLRAFARDRFYVLVSVLGLVAYVTVFWLLPASVDETIGLGIHLDGGEVLLESLADGGADEAGLEVISLPSTAALRAAVEQGEEVAAGLDLPTTFLADLQAGRRVTVQVLLPADAPEELQPALTALVRELAFALAGQDVPVTVPDLDEIVVGPDRAGQQITPRAQLRPLFVFLVLLVEMFALASLIAVEIHDRTITAILATPAEVSDVLAAKGVLGTALAFVQALLLLVATGTAIRGFGIVALALLLGAVLVTGVAMLAGSIGRDFISIVFWSILLMVPLAVPAVAVLFPGSAAAWVRALPTFGLVQVLVGVTAYGDGWSEVARDLAVLAFWCLLTLAVGVAVLRRRVIRLV